MNRAADWTFLSVMSGTVALIVFCGCLLLSMASSAVLAERIDQVGSRFRIPAGFFGLVTALAADSPEITSAVSAIIGGQHELGRGVIFGSNIFNIAALIGLNAVIAGWVEVGRPNLVLNAGVAIWITAVVGAQAMGWLGPVATGVLVVLVFGPYVALSSLPRERVSRLPLPSGAADWLASALSEAKAKEESEALRPLTRMDALSLVLLLVMIVVTSVLLVRTATFLGEHWEIAEVLVGTFVIATLTGIPNMIAATRLAVRGRGAALASEAFNSNTLNLIVGAYVPTLLIPLSSPSAEAILAVCWLAGFTIAAGTLGFVRGGFGRWSGVLLLAGYAAFAVLVVF